MLRYILLSKKRILLWTVINIDQSTYSVRQIKDVIGKISFKHNLYNIYNKYGIQSAGDSFKINNKDVTYEKILDDILGGYYYWKLMRTRGQIKEFITGLMMNHKEISGKEIIDELKFKGYEFDKSLVYYHLRKLEKEGYIELTRITDSKGREKYYRLKPEAIEGLSQEGLLKRLELLLNHFGTRDRKNYKGFIQEVSNRISNKDNIFELYTFCEQLDLLRYDISLELWRLLIEYLGDEFKSRVTILQRLLTHIK